MIEITLLVERELEDGSFVEVEVTVRGKFYPGNPGSMYRANGDPGDPPESDDVEIHSSTLCDGTPWELTDSQQAEAEEKLIQAYSDEVEALATSIFGAHDDAS